MKTNRLKEAVALAKKTGHVLLATADGHGMPHIAAAGQIEQIGQDRIAVSEWFCPGTVKNLQTNRHLSIVVWDSIDDCGCQLLGHLETAKDIAVLDGYAPDVVKRPALPQVEKQLLIRIDSIFEFKLGPHTDIPQL